MNSSTDCNVDDLVDPTSSHGEIYVQLVLSLALGVSAFCSFCILRPRWETLYAARKRRRGNARALPELPNTFFGWIPALINITDEEVLESAGLDAYVFLSFFKMAIRFLAVAFCCAAFILAPINSHFDYLPGIGWPGDNETSPDLSTTTNLDFDMWGKPDPEKDLPDRSYLWAYLVFIYVFTGLLLYFMLTETTKIIGVRQRYLGSQSTITDRTIQLSGIPKDMRSEAHIKEFIEALQIGTVENVTICRHWKKLDDLVATREYALRQLEKHWTHYAGSGAASLQAQIATQPSSPRRVIPAIEETPSEDNEAEDADENANLLAASEELPDPHAKPRPQTRLRYGFMRLRYRKVDAIDYYTELLRKLDEAIHLARKEEYEPTPMAFVIMDSVPACQMAMQAVLDAHPLQFLAEPAPAPVDVMWRNTYMPPYKRFLRSWIITSFITILTIFWLIPVTFLAGLVSLCSIRKVSPGFADSLEQHDIGRALFQTGLPTITISLLNVAVPYLYDWLSYQQGNISRSHIELSLASKNFFFAFFNIFIVFSIFGTASQFWPVLKDSVRDTTKIALLLAKSIQRPANFYINFILLQAIGLFPVRLLELGSVALHPIMQATATTPREHAEANDPPVFSYGYYLPTALVVLILCIVYSVLPTGYLVLGFGLIYFIMGYFTYKYQLLYAMDNMQHATGGAWAMICHRILLGLFIFQLAMSGILALKQGFKEAVLVIPLLPFTVWFSHYFGRTYEPLLKFISLRSIRREESDGASDFAVDGPGGFLRRRSTVDELRERGQKFVNPSLTTPLQKPWFGAGSFENCSQQDSTASSFSFGDTHIWRDNNDEAV